MGKQRKKGKEKKEEKGKEKISVTVNPLFTRHSSCYVFLFVSLSSILSPSFIFFFIFWRLNGISYLHVYLYMCMNKKTLTENMISINVFTYHGFKSWNYCN